VPTCFLRAAKVFHRDLKPKNILANSDCKLKVRRYPLHTCSLCITSCMQTLCEHERVLTNALRNLCNPTNSPKNVVQVCDFGLARPSFNDMPTTIFWTDYVATRWCACRLPCQL